MDEWTQGLTNLIENIKSTSGCFKGLHEEKKYINLTIKTAQELFLITNQMIRDDTYMILEFNKESISKEESEQAAEAL